jgi:hypothetical protein
MLAAAASIPAPVMPIPPIEYGHAPLDGAFVAQRQFKKHKVLPRPQPDRSLDVPRQRPAVHYSHAPSVASQGPSPRVLKHHSKRIGSGPELPPTPPIQSRTSSGSHNTLVSNISTTEAQNESKDMAERPVVTPPDQRSPPTPDVTPPQPTTRPRAVRPSLADRAISRTTTGDSRADSFKTAREEPLSSGEEDGRSTVRQGLSSGRTSRATVRRVSDTKVQRVPQPQALDFALSRLSVSPEGTYTQKTKGGFGQFDGHFASPDEVEPEWDDNLQRTVTVRKTSPSRKYSAPQRDKPADVERNVISPSDATKAARQLHRQDNTKTEQPKRAPSSRRGVYSAPSNSDSSASKDSQRSRDSTATSQSSAVVSAMLVDVSPQRRRTLRHVRKQWELRDSADISPDSTAEAVPTQRQSRPPLQVVRGEERQRESFASTTTTNSISSGRARREIWKSGGIPVVVIPDRRSSSKPGTSREPSLWSTSSRRSRKTMSVASVPRGSMQDNESVVGPVFERHSRRNRRFSESDRDERTIDFPPMIPARSSSLSAPTSRNTSRAGSMTAESLKSRNALQSKVTLPPQDTRFSSSSPDKDKGRALESISQATPKLLEPALVNLANSRQDLTVSDDPRLKKQHSYDKSSMDHLDDGGMKKLSSRNTPFSAASIETNGTAPEVSEALAVHMYPHQNSSLLMVDHALEATPRKRQGPKIITTDPDGNGPVTPPQTQFSLDDVDSPLRNPRSPPQPPAGPPAINFIPATPSGLTPADDRKAQMGNYFESVKEKPPRRPSIVQRALSRRRRHSLEYPPTASKPTGLLTRTFSLSRNVRRVFEPVPKPEFEDEPPYPSPDEHPVEEDKLHPRWRPQSLGMEFDGFDSVYGPDDDNEDYHYPPIDNRPRMPKRTLSERMKRTFAIFPVNDEAHMVNGGQVPERRTIRRTDSGNLRVVQRKLSADSLVRRRSFFGGQSTAPEALMLKPLWQGSSSQRRASKERYRQFSIGNTLGDIQNIPRRLSEKRREKRSQALRETISGPTEVRDGVEDMLRSTTHRNQGYAAGQI